MSELHPSDRDLALQVETGTGGLRLDLSRRLAAAAFGTGMLTVAAVGPGIAASRLSACTACCSSRRCSFITGSISGRPAG